MANSSDSEEGSDSERMMNENLPPEGLIECDVGGDTLVSCEISNKFHGRLYACGVTGMHVNYVKKHHRCLAGMVTVIHELHHS